MCAAMRSPCYWCSRRCLLGRGRSRPSSGHGRAARGPGDVDAVAVRAHAPVVVDGHFDESVWREAPVIGEFVQREPAEGGAAQRAHRGPHRLRRPARCTWPSSAFDREPARIVGHAHPPRRAIAVRLGAGGDRLLPRPAHRLRVRRESRGREDRPLLLQRRRQTTTAGTPCGTCRWRATPTAGAPSSAFRSRSCASRRGGGPVGFAVIRELPRANETSTLAADRAQRQRLRLAVRRGQRRAARRLAQAARAGAVHPGRVRDWRPVEAGNPLSKRTDPGASLGVDLKYAVTPALTLTATLNPDFGQVEADPAAVNLEAFELFFAERRPFFVEGSGMFRFNMDCNDGECTGLLYSRRIGRVPQGEIDDVGRRRVSKAPAHDHDPRRGQAHRARRRVLGGRAERGHAGGARAHRLGPRRGGARWSSRSRGFNVLRARREFANHSNLGVMLTSTNRRLTTDTRFLPEQAVTGGVDYDWRLGERYSLSGFWAGSRVAGDAEAITDAAGERRALLPAARRRSCRARPDGDRRSAATPGR